MYLSIKFLILSLATYSYWRGACSYLVKSPIHHRQAQQWHAVISNERSTARCQSQPGIPSPRWHGRCRWCPKWQPSLYWDWHSTAVQGGTPSSRPAFRTLLSLCIQNWWGCFTFLHLACWQGACGKAGLPLFSSQAHRHIYHHPKMSDAGVSQPLHPFIGRDVF